MTKNVGKATVIDKGKGRGTFRNRLRRMGMSYATATIRALYTEASEIFAESQEQVPVDTNKLRLSGLVFLKGTPVKGGRVVDTVNVFISYGTDYALAVHENTAADQGRIDRAELALSNPGYKPKGSEVGKSKYLSDPFFAAIPGIEGRISAEIKALVATGIKDHTVGIRPIKGTRR